MSPPARVKVGQHNYQLTVDAKRASDAGVDYGVTWTHRTEIVVSPDQAPSQLLHELLHAVCDDVGLTDYRDAPRGSVLPTELEERVVRALAGGVLALLRSNPRLVAYLVAP